MQKKQNPIIVGQPALIVVDIQKSSFEEGQHGIALMPGMHDRMRRARAVVDAAREGGVPIIFLQESHRKSGIDLGRELDGDEDEHCMEHWPSTAIAAEEMGLLDKDDVIVKRRYSGFIGTDMEILLKGHKADTLILIGGLTNVCIHYTFADAHQKDFHVRVVEDCVAGSDQAAHDAALVAMEYLQHGARRSSEEMIAAFTAVPSSKVA